MKKGDSIRGNRDRGSSLRMISQGRERFGPINRTRPSCPFTVFMAYL